MSLEVIVAILVLCLIYCVGVLSHLCWLGVIDPIKLFFMRRVANRFWQISLVSSGSTIAACALYLLFVVTRPALIWAFLALYGLVIAVAFWGKRFNQAFDYLV